MRFSAFSSFGHFGFSGGEPLAQRIYKSLVSGQTEAFDLTKGTYQESKLYAMAMGLARARLTLLRADNQRIPLKCVEKLPSLERDYGCHPSARDTILDRQRAVAVRKGLAKGSREGAIVAALTTLLGSEFVAYRPRLLAVEVATFPASPGDVGTWARPENTPKIIKLLSPIAMLGVAVTVPIELVTGSQPPQRGEKLTIEPEIDGIAEAITVTDMTYSSALVTTPDLLTATFTKPHTVGCFAVNGPCPVYTSNQRDVFVVLKSTAITDPEKRRKVNDLMARAVRGVTRWQLVEEGAAGHTSQWTVAATPNRLISKSILPLTI